MAFLKGGQAEALRTDAGPASAFRRLLDNSLGKLRGEGHRLVLLFFTVDAGSRPGHRVEADIGDRFFTVHADSVHAVVDSVKRFVDGTQELRIRLFES